MSALPSQPGAYLLALHLPRAVRLKVGALGEVLFPEGVYLYAGSAQGPGGVRARLGRHLRGSVRRRWHVDYLRAAAAPLACWWTLEPSAAMPWECLWSQRLAALPQVRVPMPGFGASDCRWGCAAHLLYVAWADRDVVFRVLV